MRAAILAGRVDQLAAAAKRTERLAERRFLLDALERAIILADPGALGERERRIARQLGMDEALLVEDGQAVPAHAVRIPLVTLWDRGEEPAELGFVRLVWVSFLPLGSRRDEHSLAQALDPAARRAVTQAIALAARHATVADAEGYDLVAAQPEVFERLRIEGPSIGAAAYLSALALFTRRAVKKGLAVTGRISGARVLPVGAAESKIDGALRGRSDVEQLIVPEELRRRSRAALASAGRQVQIHGVRTVAELGDTGLEPKAAPQPDPEVVAAELRNDFRGGWDRWRWPGIRERLARAVGDIPAERPDLSLEVLAMLGAVERHLGAPEKSLAVLERGFALASDPESYQAIPDLPVSILFRHMALTHVQLCRFGDAITAAKGAVNVARRGRHQGELFRALGCLGIAALARGKADEAVEHHRASLEIAEHFEPQTAPRTRTYLLGALAAAGQVEQARALYEETRPLLRQLHSDERRAGYEAWLRTQWAQALVRAGDTRHAARVLDAAPVREAMEKHPLPGLLARRWLGLSLAAGREPEEGYDLLATSPVAYGLLRAPGAQFVAQINVLCEARARLARVALGSRGSGGVGLGGDATARTLAALGALPSYGDAPRYLGEPARAVADVLHWGVPDARSATEAVAPLDALLERCMRLG